MKPAKNAERGRIPPRQLAHQGCRSAPIYEAENGKKYSVNDLNEALYYLGKEKVLEIILNAKDSPVPGVIDFSDIQDVDLDQIDGITTGHTSP